MAPTAADSELLNKLEEFFSGPDFTSAIGEFMGNNVADLEFRDLSKEQPLRNHQLFTEYTKLVEGLLQNFLESQGVTAEDVYETCRRFQQSGDTSSMVCIDYLVASTEYESFMQLAYDHCQLCNYMPSVGLTEMWTAEEEAGVQAGCQGGNQ